MFDLFWGRGRLDKTSTALVYFTNLMTLIGAHPPQRFWRYYAGYAVIYKFTLFIVIPLIFNIGYIVDFERMTVSQMLTAMQAGINIFFIPTKVLTIIRNRRRFRCAETLLAALDARCESAAEVAKIRRTAIVGNRVVMLLFGIYAIYGLTTFASSLAMGSPAYQLYLPFLNWRASRADFWQQVLIEAILFGMLLLGQVVSDSYPVIYISMVRSHTQILTERVLKLGTQPEKSQEVNYRDLIQCIVDHNVLLELHKTIASVISITIFVQFLITAVMLGLTMINIFIFADTSTRIACCFYIAAVNVQIFPCCYQATCLIEDSEQLTLATFHCVWMDQDVRFRKMLLFFMHRTQTVMTLTALKLFPINLRTNLSIAKFSFSLYTLIRNMDFGRENE